MKATDVMTKYESISTTLSIIAILLSVLIPALQWFWKKYIMAAKVNFFPTGHAMLFFNQSGSYIRIYGVLESERKAATIRKIRLVITRKLDEQKLNLVWSYLISPVSQSMLGNYLQTTEAAHPFRVEADSVACAFVEYNDPSDSSGIKIRNLCSDLAEPISQTVLGHNYTEALGQITNSRKYNEAKNSLSNDFFWDIGKYSADVIVEYGKQKAKTFYYEFSVSEQNYLALRGNIEETLLAQLKTAYQVQLTFESPLIEFTDRNI